MAFSPLMVSRCMGVTVETNDVQNTAHRRMITRPFAVNWLIVKKKKKTGLCSIIDTPDSGGIEWGLNLQMGVSGLFGNPINEFEGAFFRCEGEFLHWHLTGQITNEFKNECHPIAVPKWGKGTGKEL